ncbi:MAG TPA: hypothetical protein VHD32_02295 [Candidatus Didemnitutus sp.]|nr:hypothetical protein [Candidatus Didemnitutus sp.]
MDPATHPLLNRELYARAESAAQAAFEIYRNDHPADRVRKMDRAAMTVFRKAGTAPDVRKVFAMSISADIMEREVYSRR